jgi:eukaryotic-like serine/threonine-protein kinase
MNEDQFDKLRDLYAQACEVPLAERSAWVIQNTEDAVELRRDLFELLDQTKRADEASTLAHLKAAAADLLPDAIPSLGVGAHTPDFVGAYRVIRKLGEGGMGTVYLAQQSNPEREVAVKVLRDLFSAGSARQRFVLETKVHGRMRHVGIAQIIEAGVAPLRTSAGAIEVPFFAMEYIDGLPITDYATDQSLGTRERLEIIARICDAVHYAHGLGIIHRDLKPANILVDRSGQPKVLDFGVARSISEQITNQPWTQTGQIIGTLPYMSPEQVVGRSAAIDARSDVYALGVITFELLAGRRPIDLAGLALADAVFAICEVGTAQLSALDTRFRGDIDTIVSTALSKDPQRRYLSAAAMAADIRRYLDHEPISARPASRIYRIRKFARRHRGLVAGGLVALSILIIGIITTTTMAVRAQRSATRADLNAAEVDRQRKQSDRRLYLASLRAAEVEISKGLWAAARRSLETAPAEHRSWEWRHLASRLAISRKDVDMQSREPAPVAYRPDGMPLMIARRSRTNELICVDTGEVIQSVDRPLGSPECGSLSKDGTRAALLATDPDGVAYQVIDTSTGRSLSRIPTVATLRSGLSLDGRTLILYDAKTIEGWDVETGERMFVVSSPRNDTRLPMFHPDNRRFAVGIGGDQEKDNWGLIIRSLSDGRVVDILQGLNNEHFDWDDTGKRITSSGYSQVIVRDAESLEKLWSAVDNSGTGFGARFVGDSQVVALRADGYARRWSIPTGRLEAQYPVDYGELGWRGATFAVAPNQREILVGDVKGAVTYPLGFAVKVLPCSTYAQGVTMSSDGSLLAAVDEDGLIRIWDSWNGTLIRRRRIGRRLPDTFAFSDDGSTLWFGGAGGTAITIWDLVTDEINTEEFRDSHGLASSAPAGAVAKKKWAKSRDGTAFVARAANGELVVRRNGSRRQVSLRDSRSPHFGLAISGDGSLVAAGEANPRSGRVRVWNGQTGDLISVLDGHASECFALAFMPDRSRIVSCGRNGAILWDLATGEIVWRSWGHDSYVYDVAVSADGKIIATASGDATVRIWEASSRQERRRQANQAEELRRQFAPPIDELLGEATPRAVWKHLNDDDSITPAERDAALRILIEKAVSQPPKLLTSLPRKTSPSSDSKTWAFELTFNEPMLDLTATDLRLRGEGADRARIASVSPVQESGLVLNGYLARAEARENLRLSGPLTVEYWLRPGSPTGSVVFSYATPVNDNELMIQANSVAYFDGEEIFTRQTEHEEWTHLAVTYDPESGIVTRMQDGISIHASCRGAVVDDGGILILGNDQDSFGGSLDAVQAYRGEIDELRIWSTVRTQEEIAANRTLPASPTHPDLRHLWRFSKLEDLGVGEPGANDVRDLAGGAHFDLRAGAALGAGAPSKSWIVEVDVDQVASSASIKVDVLPGVHATDVDGHKLARNSDAKLTPLRYP